MPNHHTVTNVYDADERLTQTQNGRGDLVTYTYDGANPVTGAPQKGLLTLKTDGNGHTTYYSYTARNEPAATYYPDGTSESVTYDQNGNTVTRTKADGKVIRYAYDKDNRLTDITYPTLHATHFGYDADGRKIDMSDGTGTTTWLYTYDGLHENQQTTPQGTVYYTYDGDGRPSQRSINTPSTGQSAPWTHTYDAGGRLTKLGSPSDGATTFSYDNAGRLTSKTLGNGNYELYAYDACDEVTGISYCNPGGNYQNALAYSYDPAGNVVVCNQGWYQTTYGYDGADQLVSETNTGDNYTPSLAYTYDHNGNRLTQTSNGSQVQSFTYDAHDKLTSGTAGNETDTYDANGSETRVSIYGGVYQLTWDDEDRLVGENAAERPRWTRLFYNGPGPAGGQKPTAPARMLMFCDGASPGSPVLSDGHALYTPGLSESRGGVSRYNSYDRLGNLWFVDNAAASQSYYQDTTGFGTVTAQAGSGSPFGYGGANGCQTDADTGVVLMGHRYYDTRIGRFISQDPAGDGDNWYAYAGNSPTNAVDPMGLAPMDGPGSSPMGSPGYSDGAMSGSAGAMDEFGMNWQRHLYLEYEYQTPGVTWLIYGAYWTPSVDLGGGSPGAGMIAGQDSLSSSPEAVQLTKSLAKADDGTAGTLSKTINPVKDAAREALKKLHATEEQFASANRAISRATTSSKIAVRKEMQNIIVEVSRAGRYGYQVMENVIDEFGGKQVTQKAYTPAGVLDHDDPK